MEIKAPTPAEFLQKCIDAHKEETRLRKDGAIGQAEEYRIAAERGYNQFLNREPTNGSALRLLGLMYQQRGFNGLCINLCTIALKNFEIDLREAKLRTDEHFQHRIDLCTQWISETYATLATAERSENFRDLAVEHYDKAMELCPNHADVIAAAAGLHINDGTPQDCIDLLQRATKISPQIEDEESWNWALAHLELGHWIPGFDLYAKGIKGKERLNRNYWASGQMPEWDGTPDKTVVVYGEQGVGDEIMFASIIPELIRDSKKVIFDCHPRLEKLFRRSFPGVEIQPTRKTSPEWAFDRKDIDARIAIGTLPVIYRRKTQYFKQYEDGYLLADPARVDHYRQRLMRELGSPPHIGLAWQGGGKKTRFDLRSIDPTKFAPILSQNARFISMNYIPETVDEAKDLGIPYWPEAIEDLDEMAALIVALDLVITVNQSLVHQAGALGQNCWTLTPSRPAWRYGIKGSKMIWYPSVTQFRQKMDEPWTGAIQRVADSFKSFVSKYAEYRDSWTRTVHENLQFGAAD